MPSISATCNCTGACRMAGLCNCDKRYMTVAPADYNPPYVKQGWQCPVCKAVYAPHVGGCFNCN